MCGLDSFDENLMEAELSRAGQVRPRSVLLVGAFVVGWSMGRTIVRPAGETRTEQIPTTVDDNTDTPPPLASRAEESGRPGFRRLAIAGALVAVVLAGTGLVLWPADARAPLVSPAVAARERARAARQAESTRLHLLRRLELAGITARRVGPIDPPPAPIAAPEPVVHPSERAIALDDYVQTLGTQTILTGLDASRDRLQQQVLHDSRVHIYPAGVADITSNRLDVRVLAIIEYLAQADGEVSVSCLITGHSLYVHGRPGVVSAHVYGRAVDISAVGDVPILGHQGPGTVTEKAIEQILALPASVEPLQVISLMSLGGPSFALPDHYNHIHVGY